MVSMTSSLRECESQLFECHNKSADTLRVYTDGLIHKFMHEGAERIRRAD